MTMTCIQISDVRVMTSSRASSVIRGEEVRCGCMCTKVNYCHGGGDQYLPLNYSLHCLLLLLLPCPYCRMAMVRRTKSGSPAQSVMSQSGAKKAGQFSHKGGVMARQIVAKKHINLPTITAINSIQKRVLYPATTPLGNRLFSQTNCFSFQCSSECTGTFIMFLGMSSSTWTQHCSIYRRK